MKKIKFEDILAGFLLLSVLILFASFLFNGASLMFAAFTLAIAFIGGAMVLLLRNGNAASENNGVRKTITVLLLFVAMTGSLITTANAALSANLGECQALSAAKLTLTAYQSNNNSNGVITSSHTNGVDTISITAKGYYNSCNDNGAATATVKILNEQNSTVTMTVGLVDNAVAKLNGSTAVTNGTTVTLAQNQYLEISVTSDAASGADSLGDKIGSATFSNVSVEVPDIPTTTNFKVSTGGTFTVDGAAVTADCSIEKSAKESYALVATASNGYEFVSWISDNGVFSTAATASYQAAAGVTDTVYPQFKKTGAAKFYINGASPVTYYYYLDEAIKAAGMKSIGINVTVTSVTPDMPLSSTAELDFAKLVD